MAGMTWALIVLILAIVVWLAWALRFRSDCGHKSWLPWRADYYLDPITRARRPFEWRSCTHCKNVQTRQL